MSTVCECVGSGRNVGGDVAQGIMSSIGKEVEGLVITLTRLRLLQFEGVGVDAAEMDGYNGRLLVLDLSEFSKKS